MVDLEDVDAGFVDLGGDRGERAGLVVRGDVEPGDAALADEIADKHVGEQVRVDVAAAQKVATFLPLKRSGSRKHRGKSRGASAFNDGLLDADQHRDGAFEVALGNEHDVVRHILRGSAR